MHRDAAVVWHGFTQMAAFSGNSPVIVERAEGRELIDVAGRRYLDAISSLWVNTLGHHVPELDAALVEQAPGVAHTTMLGNGNTAVVALAEALAPVVPVDDPHFLFAADGAVAVEQALKIAWQYWANVGERGRTRFLALGDGYHGDTIGALSLGDGGLFSEVFDPLRFPVVRTPGYADPGWASKACAAIAAHAGELAAVVLEPLVQGAAGIEVAERDDVAAVGHACRGRGDVVDLRRGGHGVRPHGHLVRERAVRAASGPPLPRKGADRRLPADVGDRCRRTGVHGVLGRGPGAAHLLPRALLRRERAGSGRGEAPPRASSTSGPCSRTSTSARPSSPSCSRPRIAPHAAVGAIRQRGLMIGVALDPPRPGLRWGRRVCAAAVAHGVLLRPLGDVVVIMPPLTTTSAEAVRIVEALDGALAEVAGTGSAGR